MKAQILLKSESGELVETTIDLTLNASQNAKQFFESRTKLKLKEEKTIAATHISLKKANQSAIAEIKNRKLQNRKKKAIANRKPFWFEKFFWFLSSENYLVITARDAQQNEVLIKKYAKPNDIVFHAHIEGAAFTVVKNNSDKPIPNLTISETATVALAHSRAWDDKVIIQVYWVHANQVSKSAPTGMFLPTGSFMIYGKKNFIQPFKLEMGFGLCYKVDDENIERHKGERFVKEEFILQNSIEEEKQKTQSDQLDQTNPEEEKKTMLDQIAGDFTKKDSNMIKIDKKLKIAKKDTKEQQKEKKKDEKEKKKEQEIDQGKKRQNEQTS